MPGGTEKRHSLGPLHTLDRKTILRRCHILFHRSLLLKECKEITHLPCLLLGPLVHIPKDVAGNVINSLLVLPPIWLLIPLEDGINFRR